MSAIASLVKWIMALAALVGSVETIIRLAKFAWSIVIRLTGTRRFTPSFRFARA